MTTNNPAVVQTLVVPGRPAGLGPPRWPCTKGMPEQDAEALAAAIVVDVMSVAGLWRSRATPQEDRRVALYVPEGLDDPMVVEMAALAGARVVQQNSGTGADVVRAATVDELDRGATSVVVLMGAVPTLPVHLIEEAHRACLFHDVVAGPTFNGSAWALCLRRDEASRPREDALLETLFPPGAKAGWSTVGAILDRAAARHLAVHLMPFWPDATDATDLSALRLQNRYQAHRGSTAGTHTRHRLDHLPPPPATLPRTLRRS